MKNIKHKAGYSKKKKNGDKSNKKKTKKCNKLI